MESASAGILVVHFFSVLVRTVCTVYSISVTLYFRTGVLTNGYYNVHANGHVNDSANGYANEHVNGSANGLANGSANGHCLVGDDSPPPPASVYVFDAEDTSSVPRRALARLLEPDPTSTATIANGMVAPTSESALSAASGSLLTHRARPQANGLCNTGPDGGGGSASSTPVAPESDATANGVCARSTMAPLYLTRRSPDSLTAPQAARAMKEVLGGYSEPDLALVIGQRFSLDGFLPTLCKFTHFVYAFERVYSRTDCQYRTTLVQY